MNVQFWFNHPMFSWLINKNPTSIYNQSLNNKFDILGKFVDENIYQLQSIPNDTNFIRYAKDENLDKYLMKEKYIVSPLTLIVLEKMFREPMRGKFNIDYDDEPHCFHMSFSPIIIHDKGMFKELFTEYFDDITVRLTMHNLFDFNTHINVYTLDIYGKEKLSLLLQKVFILLMTYTKNIAPKKLLPNHEQLDKFLLLTTEWLDKNSKFYNFIIKRGGGNNYGASYLQNDGEVTDKKFTTNLSGQRYQAVVNAIPQNAKILDIGCNNGRMAIEMIKRKDLVINQYVGLDASEFSIIKAREKIKSGKFKFYRNNFLYMDKLYWDDADVIILSEIIEHLSEEDRVNTINFLVKNSNNKKLIITVPNKSVNEAYWGISDDEYRHKDHKIEYTLQSFQKDIIFPFELKGGYHIEYVNISDDMFFFDDQISFMVVISKI